MLITEFLADPKTVADSSGEWVELYNPAAAAVNLAGWTLADADGEHHTITAELWLAGGAYLVLGRQAAPEQNGGAPVAYAYAGFTLANNADEILLRAPDGATVDQVAWGDGRGLEVTPGASLERSTLTEPAIWVAATAAWPGSAGDMGSPGAPFAGVVSPTTTATATPTAPVDAPVPTALATLSATATQTEDVIELPTPTDTPLATATATFHAPATPTADLIAQPTLTDTPAPTPTGTPTVVATAVPTATQLPATATQAATSPATSIATATSTATPAPTDMPAEAIHLLITEFLADPKTVADSSGEWVELYNPAAASVNLAGWTLADADGEHHTITAELWLAGGAYLVLGRQAAPEQNGGAPVAYAYAGFTLANGADEILLRAPDGATVDQVAWGDGRGLEVTPGASLERSTLTEPAIWVAATAAWPGSAGDLGSPGAPFAGTVSPTATATATVTLLATPTGSPTPAMTATAADTATPTKDALALPAPTDSPVPATTSTLAATATPVFSATATTTQPPATANATPTPPTEAVHLLITEFLADPKAVADSSGEWVELYNPTGTAVNLAGWTLADADGEHHTITAELWLAGGAYLVLGRQAAPEQNGGAPVAYAYAGFTLANGADEILLRAPDGATVDQVAWGDGRGLDVTPGASLERSTLTEPATWVAATAAWPGSAGDLGSPGAPFAGAVSPTATATAAATVLATPTGSPTPAMTATSADTATPTKDAIALPTPTDSPVPAATSTLAATATPVFSATATTTHPPATANATPTPPAEPVHLLITEFLADPKAVADSSGEWVELYNPTGAAVNLAGWTLADADGEHHTITAELWIAGGAYLVLGRQAAPEQNGGAPVAYAYAGFTLANGADEILLHAPDGATVDQVAWGDGRGLDVTPGASQERSTLTEPAAWVAATAAWPGSAGDLGSPGAPFFRPDTLTSTPTPAATLGIAWPPASESGELVIEEVYFRGSDEEFIALSNTGSAPLLLTGYVVGDADIPGASEGLYALPSGASLKPDATFVLARHGAAFRTRYGRPPDAEWEDTDPAIPDLASRADLARGALALSDAGDEVILLNADGQLVDAIAFGEGNYAGLHLQGELRAGTGLSLQRVPGVMNRSELDIRHSYLYAPPAPFSVLALPAEQLHANPALGDGYVATWGSLGAQSNFSAGGVAPPQYLLAAAGAMGLDFLAIADSTAAVTPPTGGALTHLPAFRWADTEGKAAIVYTDQYHPELAFEELPAFVRSQNALVQWQVGTPPAALPNWIAFAPEADESTDLAGWFPQWQASGRPLLPAGNSTPVLPGSAQLAPRYTGLAAQSAARAHLSEALSAQRGWLATAPGLGLALYAEADDGRHYWMGSLVAPTNILTLHVSYSDATGQPAGLAIWQDGKPIRQLDIPPAAGHWSIQVPAIPGAVIVAAASQADGDFAITAPLLVGAADQPGRVLINEALPAPQADLNGDGLIDGYDEFIELWNPASQPVDLGGWLLSNTHTDTEVTRRYRFPTGRFIAGGKRLVLWRKETRLNLNGLTDSLRLLRPDDTEADFVAWGEDAVPGRSVARLPDGGPWSLAAAVTPGQPNAPGQLLPIRPGAGAETPSQQSTDRWARGEPTPAPTLEPTHGQAGGPPGSVAQAKLAGLNAWVEFQAVVTLPPGLITDTIYVADPVASGVAGLGVRVYLRRGDFPLLAQGDWVSLRGRFRSYRGEMELSLDDPSQVWLLRPGTMLRPLPVELAAVGERLEGRLITVTGVVSGWQGASIFLVDATQAVTPPVRIVTPSVPGWRRPYVRIGQHYRVIGVVSQSAPAAPWNGGYRILALELEYLPATLREAGKIYRPPGVRGP